MRFLFQFIIVGLGIIDLLFGFVQPISWAFAFIIFGGLAIPAEIIADWLTWRGIPEKPKKDSKQPFRHGVEQ